MSTIKYITNSQSVSMVVSPAGYRLALRPGSSQRSGLDSRSSLKIFRFFFTLSGCTLNCEDHFHFHIFIRSSKI